MKLLAIGDITSPAGLTHLCERLWQVRRTHGIDLCIVNGENASLITGIHPADAERLLQSGADVITGGNHTLRQKAAYTALDEMPELLRPINFTSEAPGHGYTIVQAEGYHVLVINAMGTVHMEPVLDSPYPFLDRVLEREAGRYDLAVLDIHAEATGEKLAMGYAYDGKIQVVFGTHTHVPTADGKILPGGTGYISDLGMCGESGGVLGMEPCGVVRRMRTRLPLRFEPAAGPCVADGVIFEVDPQKKVTTAIHRITF